jgi:hypothetical protein
MQKLALLAAATLLGLAAADARDGEVHDYH